MQYNKHPVWHGSSLAHLSQYIGTDNNRAVLDDPKIVRSMKHLLLENYQTVRERLLERPAIIDFYLYFIGLRGSLTGGNDQAEAALLVIDLTNGMIYSGLQTNGKIIVFGNHGPDIHQPHYIELPQQLRLWVADAAYQTYADEPPSKNFEWRY